MSAVHPPAPGVAVLACRCGTVLDAAQMCRRTHTPQHGAAARVDRITCAHCADPAVPLDVHRHTCTAPDQETS